MFVFLKTDEEKKKKPKKENPEMMYFLFLWCKLCIQMSKSSNRQKSETPPLNYYYLFYSFTFVYRATLK